MANFVHSAQQRGFNTHVDGLNARGGFIAQSAFNSPGNNITRGAMESNRFQTNNQNPNSPWYSRPAILAGRVSDHTTYGHISACTGGQLHHRPLPYSNFSFPTNMPTLYTSVYASPQNQTLGNLASPVQIDTSLARSSPHPYPHFEDISPASTPSSIIYQQQATETVYPPTSPTPNFSPPSFTETDLEYYPDYQTPPSYHPSPPDFIFIEEDTDSYVPSCEQLTAETCPPQEVLSLSNFPQSTSDRTAMLSSYRSRMMLNDSPPSSPPESSVIQDSNGANQPRSQQLNISLKNANPSQHMGHLNIPTKATVAAGHKSFKTAAGSYADSSLDQDSTCRPLRDLTNKPPESKVQSTKESNNVVHIKKKIIKQWFQVDTNNTENSPRSVYKWKIVDVENRSSKRKGSHLSQRVSSSTSISPKVKNTKIFKSSNSQSDVFKDNSGTVGRLVASPTSHDLQDHDKSEWTLPGVKVGKQDTNVDSSLSSCKYGTNRMSESLSSEKYETKRQNEEDCCANEADDNQTGSRDVFNDIEIQEENNRTKRVIKAAESIIQEFHHTGKHATSLQKLRNRILAIDVSTIVRKRGPVSEEYSGYNSDTSESCSLSYDFYQDFHEELDPPDKTI